MRRDTSELLAAFVDGVTELSTEERRRIEARIAAEPALRGDAAVTRDLLGELRELPRTSEPDWAALERSIGDAVGPDAPKRWRGWRWLVPVLALATVGAIAMLVLQDPKEPASVVDQPIAPTPAPSVEAAVEPLPFWLNGQTVEVELEALDALEDELVGELRELPRTSEPDWAALERSIGEAVGPDAPKRWRGWRWLVPVLALATVGAIAMLVLQDPKEPASVVDQPIARAIPTPAPSVEAAVEPLPFWLNGQTVEVELEALDALEDELVGEDADDALLSTSDLEWVDALDEAALERAERWLDDRPHRKRKKS